VQPVAPTRCNRGGAFGGRGEIGKVRVIERSGNFDPSE